MENETISFGAYPSKHDSRTFQADKFGTAAPKEHGKVPLDFDMVNELCNQRKLGICTKCGVREAAEAELKDGIRLSEYWGYLIGKAYDDKEWGEHFEGSSAFTMLRAATNDGIPEEKFCEAFPLKVDGTYAEFIADFNTTYGGKVPAAILENAKKHRIGGYYYVQPTPEGVAAEIEKGKVVIARFAVGENTYTDKNGKPSRKAKDLLPIRAPKNLEGGHIWDINEYWKFGAELGGPNSWSRTWCVGNTKQEDGYFWFEHETQKKFFTEAWAIKSKEEKYKFTKTLRKFDTGADVVALQKFLVKEDCLVMPAGIAFGYFGTITFNAVIKLQEKYAEQILHPVGLTKGTGFVGTSTLKFLNS